MNSTRKPVDIIVSVHVLSEEYVDYLRQCISSIILNCPRENYNLICVIDRGWDGTEQFLENFRAKGWIDNILRNTSQRGWTRTNNIGLEESDAEFAILINMDTVIQPGWFDRMLECARRTEAGVVGCKLIDEFGRINHAGAFGTGFHKGMNEPNTSYFDEEPAEWVTGACFMISKKLRQTIGNLDENFPHWGSDREYCLAARKAGFEIMYCPATILHYTEKSKSPETDAYFEGLPR